MADNFLNNFNAMDHAFDGHGDMTSSGSLRFDAHFGRGSREVWFSGERPEEAALDVEDNREGARLERERGLDRRTSFDNLIRVGARQDITLRETLDTEKLMRTVISDLQDGVETLPQSDHTRLQVLRALEDKDGRMTREWDSLRATLEEEFTAATAKGESLEASRLALLEGLRKLHVVAPFLPDRPDLGEARALYEVDKDALDGFKKNIDGFASAGRTGTVMDNLTWTLEVMTAGHSLPGALHDELVRLGGVATATPTVSLQPEEALLLSMLRIVEGKAPFGPAYPKQNTHLGPDWKAQLDTNREEVFNLELGHTNLSSVEKDFIRDLEADNFMGTSYSTFAWFSMVGHKPARLTAKFVGDVLNSRSQADPTDEPHIIAGRLRRIASQTKYVQGQMKRQAGLRKQFDEMVDMEALPVPKMKRQLGRLWRNMKRGTGLSFEKASDAEKVLAGLAAVALAWFFSSHEQGKKVGGALAKGGLGIGVIAGLNVLSGGLLKGKTAMELLDKKFALAGRPIKDGIYDVFKYHAPGKNRDEKEQHISYIGDLMKMAGTNNSFGSLLEKYEAAKAPGGDRRIYLNGVSDDGVLGDLQRAPSEAAFLAMDLFYARYGKEIRRYQSTHDGDIPLENLSFTEVVMELVSADKEYKEQKYPLLALVNRLGDGAQSVMTGFETAVDRVGEALSPRKRRLRKYLKEELFKDETKYGKEVHVPRDEKVLTLPGGVQTAFEFVEGEKEQDKNPGKELTGFILKKVDGTPVTFYFNELNPDAIQQFAKQLIIDTGRKKLEEARTSQERSSLESFNQVSPTLRWNPKSHKWMLPAMMVGEGSYSMVDDSGAAIAGSTVDIPARAEHFFVNCYNLDRGGFGINFFQVDAYWEDRDKAPRYNLEQIHDVASQKAFKEWVISESQGFPFSPNELVIENWGDIRDGRAQIIQGYVDLSTPLRFHGLYSGGWSFEYTGLRDTATLATAYKEKLNGVIEQLKDLGDEMPEDWKSHWKKFFKLDFAGPFNERQWGLSLDQKRDQIRGLINARDASGSLLIGAVNPDHKELVSSYIQDLDSLARSMEETISLEEKSDASDFEGRLRKLEGLALSGTQQSEYNYLRTQAEGQFNLNENAKYAMLDLFVELTSEASTQESAGSGAAKQNAQAYIAYISQAIIDHFYKQGAHRIGQEVTEDIVTGLRGEIDTARSRSAKLTPPSGVVEKLNEWPTFSEYTGNLAQYQFATSIHMLERSWLEYANLTTKSVFDKFRWRKAGKYLDYNTTPKISGDMLNLPFSFGFDSSKKWGGISGKFDLNSMGSPMLGDLMEWATSPSKWDLMIRPIDIMGGDPQQMINDLSYPALLRGSSDFKRQLVIETEEFIRDNIGNVNNRTTPASFEKLYEQYDLMIRGTATFEGLWDTYLKPELIAKDPFTEGTDEDIEIPPNNSHVQKAKDLVSQRYPGAAIRRAIPSSRNPALVTVYYRLGGQNWKVTYNDGRLSNSSIIISDGGGDPESPENPGNNVTASAKAKIQESFPGSKNIRVTGSGNVRKVTFEKADGTKWRTAYFVTTKKLGPASPIR